MSTTPTPILFPTNQDLDPRRLREAFGVHPSGVVAVAARVDGRPVGLAASSFTSVSLDPPLVSFSIANSSKTWPDLRRADHLGVSVLAHHHGQVCRQLAGPVEDRFTDVPHTVGDRGAVTCRGRCSSSGRGPSTGSPDPHRAPVRSRRRRPEGRDCEVELRIT